jgi:hypothetical protein
MFPNQNLPCDVICSSCFFLFFLVRHVFCQDSFLISSCPCHSFLISSCPCPFLDLRITINHFKSYCKRTPAKVLETHEKEKKRKYLGPCLEQRQHFTPFVCSVDGMALLSRIRLRQRLAEHCHRVCHPSVSTGKPSPRAQNQCPSSSMGRWSWFSTFSLLNYHLHNAGVLSFWITSRLLLSFSLPMDKQLN